MRKLISVLFVFLIIGVPCAYARENSAENSNYSTAGVFYSSNFSGVYVSRKNDIPVIQSAIENSAGFFYNHDCIGLDIHVYNYSPASLSKANSSFYNGTLTATNNSLYNKLSLTVMSGAYSEKGTSEKMYYPNFSALHISDSFLWFVPENISLKNIFLGTDKPAEHGGAVFFGGCFDYTNVSNSENIMNESLNPYYANESYDLRKFSYLCISPVIGFLYNFTFFESFNICFGMGSGLSYVLRTSIKNTHGGSPHTVYYSIFEDRNMVTFGMGYTAENFWISSVIDGVACPEMPIDDNKVSFQELLIKIKAGARF